MPLTEAAATEPGLRTSSSFSPAKNKKKPAEMTVYQDIAGAKVDQPVTIEIGVDSSKVALKGETATDEMSGDMFGVAKKIRREARGCGAWRRTRENGKDRANLAGARPRRGTFKIC